MSELTVDAAVIGGGIAGVSVAAFLAQKGVTVNLFEMESTLAYHTTGRSAALFTPNYGPDSIRAFAKVAVNFLHSPPAEVDAPLLSEQGLLTAVTESYLNQVEQPEGTEWIDESECLEIVPILRQHTYVGGVYEAAVAGIDVHGLHNLYVKMYTNAGGTIFRNSEISEIQRVNGVWEIHSKYNNFRAKSIVNAAGAWGDLVAQMAGIEPVGLIPKRRTAVLINNNQLGNHDSKGWPLVAIDRDYVYFQPFGSGRVMLSPADETPSPPGDAQPEELDVAIGIARFEEMTTAEVKRIEHSWAGLRTFAPDGHPVVGWDLEVEDFFWVVGQGGYGIFTSPGIGRYASELFCGNQISAEFVETGFDFSVVNPKRFQMPLAQQTPR